MESWNATDQINTSHMNIAYRNGMARTMDNIRRRTSFLDMLLPS